MTGKDYGNADGRGTLSCIAFTGKGKILADRLASALGGEAMRCGEPLGLREWTADRFAASRALIFVGAAGIAVRAIAPYVKDKTADPAVVVADEEGRFAIPILSGHLGGANDLARAIGRVCGAVPVLTTATDVNSVFAVDEWARHQNCAIVNTGKIKEISGRLLAGGTVRVYSDWPVAGALPPGIQISEEGDCDMRVSLCAKTGDSSTESRDVLRLVPRIAVLGVGCRRGISQEAIEEAMAVLLTESGLCEQAVCGAATIDLKQNEPGLRAFCAAHKWPLYVYNAEQLREAAGSFASSAFVEQVTGVDNVCERAAVLAAGGPLRLKKRTGNGVAMAVALRPFEPTWRWLDE